MDAVSCLTLACVLLLTGALLAFALLGGTFLRRFETTIESRYYDAHLIKNRVTLYGYKGFYHKMSCSQGTLILTDTLLIYEGWPVRCQIAIPLERLQNTQITYHYRTHVSIFPLLKTDFLNNAGKEATAVWQMGNPQELQLAIWEIIEA